MFSSESFMVSSFTFRSLIHLEFIVVYGMGKCSGFILLHVSCPIFPAPLIFSIVYFCLLCCRLITHISLGLFLGCSVPFYSVPLICVSIFVPILYYFDDCSFVVWS